MISDLTISDIRDTITHLDQELVLIIDLGSGCRSLDIITMNGRPIAGVRCSQHRLRPSNSIERLCLNGNLSPASIQVTAQFLKEIAEAFSGVPFQQRIIFATEAVRAARNQAEFLAAIKDYAGSEWIPRVLPGEEEAELIGRAALQYGQFDLVIHLGNGSLDWYIPATNASYSQPKPSLAHVKSTYHVEEIFGDAPYGRIAITGKTARRWNDSEKYGECPENAFTNFYDTLSRLWPEAELIYVPTGVREGLVARHFPNISSFNLKPEDEYVIKFNEADLPGIPSLSVTRDLTPE